MNIEMIWEVIRHEYFLLSFLPLVLLGGGFWVLYFDRMDSVREPLWFLSLALLAGVFSCLIGIWLLDISGLDLPWVVLLLEEILKVMFAIFFLEIFHKRFTTVGQAIMYGVAIGIGFAVCENLIYLVSIYGIEGRFSEGFWIVFQGRFWGSGLLHALTTGFFAFYYGSAYLSARLGTAKKESALKFFCTLPSLREWWQILTLHVGRAHLLWGSQASNHGHRAVSVLWEGLWGAVLIHMIFNHTLDTDYAWLGFVFVFIGMWWLGKKAQ